MSMGWNYVSELWPLDEYEETWAMIFTRENPRTRRKTSSSVTLSTANPTWTNPEANPGLRGERPATKPPEPWHGLEDHNHDHVDGVRLRL
jgi:hypothetical protein